MKELYMIIKELRGLADRLEKVFLQEPPVTLEQVREVLSEKSRAGYTSEVRELLQKYGAAKLSQIDPANYASLMKDAEVIGNDG